MPPGAVAQECLEACEALGPGRTRKNRYRARINLQKSSRRRGGRIKDLDSTEQELSRKEL